MEAIRKGISELLVYYKVNYLSTENKVNYLSIIE